jgi:hypothetical protein
MSKNVLPTESCASEKGTWETMTPEKKEPRLVWIAPLMGEPDGPLMMATARDSWPGKYEHQWAKFIEHSAYRELEEANKRQSVAIEKLKWLIKLTNEKMGVSKNHTDYVFSEIDAIINHTMEK